LQPSPEASDFYYHPFVAQVAPEILGEIFRLCLPRDNHKEGAIKAVMRPAHVCKHWRDVALSTPTWTLWIKIVLRVTNETFESRAALVNHLVFPIRRLTFITRPRRTRLHETTSGGSWLFFFSTAVVGNIINFCVPFDILRSVEAAEGHRHTTSLITSQTSRTSQCERWIPNGRGPSLYRSY
jgi:hypothetical protein